MVVFSGVLYVPRQVKLRRGSVCVSENPVECHLHPHTVNPMLPTVTRPANLSNLRPTLFQEALACHLLTAGMSLCNSAWPGSTKAAPWKHSQSLFSASMPRVCLCCGLCVRLLCSVQVCHLQCCVLSRECSCMLQLLRTQMAS